MARGRGSAGAAAPFVAGAQRGDLQLGTSAGGSRGEEDRHEDASPKKHGLGRVNTPVVPDNGRQQDCFFVCFFSPPPRRLVHFQDWLDCWGGWDNCEVMAMPGGGYR